VSHKFKKNRVRNQFAAFAENEMTLSQGAITLFTSINDFEEEKPLFANPDGFMSS